MAPGYAERFPRAQYVCVPTRLAHDLGRDSGVPRWLRVYYLGMERVRKNGHAAFRQGELAREMAVDIRTGVVKDPDTKNLSHDIKAAVARGLLDRESSTRCLILPAYSCVDARYGHVDEVCVTCDVRSVSRAARARKRASKGKTYSIGDESLTRGDGLPSRPPSTTLSSLQHGIDPQRLVPSTALRTGQETPELEKPSLQHGVEEAEREPDRPSPPVTSRSETTAAPEVAGHKSVRLKLVVDDTTPDPSADRARIKRHFRKHVDVAMKLDDVAHDLSLSRAFVEQVCRELYQRGFLDLDLDLDRRRRTYVRTRYAERASSS